MRVVITGPGGFLASHLARTWSRQGVQVDGIGRSRRTGPIDEQRRWEDVDAAWLAGADVVVHAATCYGRAGESPEDVEAANHALPRRLAELAGTAGVPHLIVIDTALDAGVNPYAAAKARLRTWLDTACSAGIAPATTSLRTQHFYGSGDDGAKFTARVVRALATSAPALALTAGTQRRDFIHVDDAAAAVMRVAAGSAPARTHRLLDLGSGEAVSIRAFVELAARLSGATTRLEFGAVAMRPGEPELLVADVRALAALGWRPTIALADGLAGYLAAERAAITAEGIPCAS